MSISIEDVFGKVREEGERKRELAREMFEYLSEAQ